jgi:predicted RNA-binding protein YlxR (DUF448 family)
VGCGRRAGQDELLRLALAALGEHDGAAGRRVAVLDSEGSLGGRGAYLCRDRGGERPRPECLEHAIRRGSVGRTLHASVSLDPKLVESVGP